MCYFCKRSRNSKDFHLIMPELGIDMDITLCEGCQVMAKRALSLDNSLSFDGVLTEIPQRREETNLSLPAAHVGGGGVH